jgi:hypothetical protein
VTNLCDYCNARLPADAGRRVPKPKLPGDSVRDRSGKRGEAYWLVHERCVMLAIAHLRFDAAHR